VNNWNWIWTLPAATLATLTLSHSAAQMALEHAARRGVMKSLGGKLGALSKETDFLRPLLPYSAHSKMGTMNVISFTRGSLMIPRLSTPVVSGVLCCLAIAGCNVTEKMHLQSQINDLAGQKQSLARTAVQQQAGVEALNQRLNVQAAELSEYRSKIVGYMMDHKMVVIALAAGVAGAGVALDSNNSFSEDAKNVGGWAAAVAAIYALANLGEVSDVLNNLNQADTHVHVLEAGMAQTRSQIQQQQLGLQSINNQLAEITQKVENLQARLDHL